ncbi:putative bifunctional diguanylate cyclase/phosphodiesterase [Robertmurraya andreesenii]|uniref:Diguanylate cyclase (GGDEF)-like protein/PAS domain S-box-containing protein n=1 Tax=Anoxybacillus andreesenii TaxID=1325932 RepID=A0ABT9V2J2_9BACL|nr:EAL domain-containing protein [Robertmurraya andreesenii]MDQ0155169.1 diguanylate cyclase (GGDEF)-like protein/PAS domain S-box-containing protein [Robertmurraya andreesenii]
MLKDDLVRKVGCKDVLNERQLSAKVLENISEGVIIADEKGSILSVNPAFEIVTGYSEEEVLGKNPSMFQSGIHGPEFYKVMWEEIYSTGKWKGEIWNKKKNGEVYPEWLTISSITDQDGKITNFVAVFSDLTGRKHTEDKLRKLAHYDTLTGVANRYSLNTRLESLIQTALKYKQQLAILFLDLDRFKHINDTLGHSYGDMLLKEVSLRLKGLIKNKDIIARLGGDEFVIVLTNIKHPKEAVHVAEDIIHSLARSFLLHQHEVYISTSIGISFFPLDGLTMEALLRNADKAMYKAKSSGKNQYELYHHEMHKNESKIMQMEVLLRKAIENDEFFLVYHPQVDMKSKQIVGVEALVRWKQKELGIVSPGEFIPLAEETGLIIPISEWVIKKACEDILNIHLKGYSNMYVSINISALHFNHDSFFRSIEAIFDQVNVDPRAVEFELTESMIMPNASETIGKLVKLKKLGIKLSIDDFGTGYSSLSYLNRFPLDTLKIDKSFIGKLGIYQDDSSIVEAIISIAHRLNLKIVAEGVENKKQMDFLSRENCDRIQGFYITKPIPYPELLNFLENWDEDLLN